MAARESHWATLMGLRPHVLTGDAPESLMYTTRLGLPDWLTIPSVGGVIPRQGRPLPPTVERGPFDSPYAPQQWYERRFFTPSVPLPDFFGGYY